MGSTLNHIGAHIGHELAKEAFRRAGCMVTFILLLTGIGTVSAIVGLVFLS